MVFFVLFDLVELGEAERVWTLTLRFAGGEEGDQSLPARRASSYVDLSG